MSAMRRMTGKPPGMNPAVSCSRLRQVQSVLCDGGRTTSDGVLCVLGIDSRYNEGCTELARFLFYGLYGRNQTGLDHVLEEFPEEVLDDVILLIQWDRVHLYCNPVNYSYLLPYVSHWRNLHLYCLTPTEYEDEEAAEEFKISSFVSMIKDCSCIRVPYSPQGHVQKFDMFMMEKWPIIQAFALEGIGGGSFFTMKYKLMDVSERLWQTYSRLDPLSLENLLAEDLVSFEKQWSNFYSSMDLESHLSIQEVSEAQAGEVFRSYYCHGLISSNITEKSKGRQPFVLFGSHSSKEDLERHSFNFPSESHVVRTTGTRGAPATHMVLQCVSPKGPLACARTYFFGTTHSPYLGNQNGGQQKTDHLLLSQIYSAAVKAVLSGIKCYSCSSSASKAKDVAEQTFLLALDSMNLSQYRSALRSQSEFTIQAVNNEGRVVPLSDEGSRYVVKTASLTVADIPDLQRGRGDLGSVVFSECFLESTIDIQQKDGGVSPDCCYTILTTTVPRYTCWLVEGDVKQSEQAQLLVKQTEEDTCLGRALTGADGAYVCSSSLLSTPEEGKISFFSEGLLFVHPQYGSITLSRHHITRIRLFHEDSGAVASVFVEYDRSLLSHLPFPLHSPDRCLLFSLQPRSKSHKDFYSKVLSVWQSSDSALRLQPVDKEELSWDQRSMHGRLQKLHESQEPPVAKRRGSMKTSYSHLPEQDMFLQHFALSSVGQEPILNDHLGALFPSADLRSPLTTPPDKVVITIITGLPGSYKKNLGTALVQLNTEGGRWVVYQPDPDSDGFSAAHLQHFLSNVLDSQRVMVPKPRLLLLTPGYTDVLEVVQAILFHPDPVVQTCFSIGAVTACVEPLSSCMEHRFTFPKLVEQCSQGVVSAVVFTGPCSERKHPSSRYLHQLLRAANPSAAFILAEGGVVTRNEDVKLILSDSSFNQSQMLRARYLLYPGWCKGRYSTGLGGLVLTQQRLLFHRPLERSLFITRCKALKSSLRGNPFRGNLYHVWGKVLFTDSERMMEVSYDALSGALTVAPDRDHPPPGDHHETACFLAFHGVGLTRDALQDWLRLCAKQKEMKKVKRTRNSVSPQEIQSIHASRHLEPLPSGFYYNGHQYVDIFGEKRLLHPNMEQFIREYVCDANREIELFNSQLGLQTQPDLFDP